MKRILSVLFTALCFFSCSTSDYTIEGSVQDKALNGTTIFIKERINREWISQDSTIIENEKFTFKGVSDSVKIVHLAYEFPKGKKVRQAFVLENGKLTAAIDSTGYMFIKGTSQNNLLQSYQDEKNTFYKKAENFSNTHKDSIKTTEQQLAYAKEENKLNSEEVSIDKKFATKNVNTIVGNFVFTNSFYGWTTSEKEALVALFNNDTKKNTRIKEILADIETEKKIAVGNQYTDFRLPDLNGDSISLSDLVGKTDYVLVDFWASWCGDCIHSFPELKTLYNSYKGSRFEIIGVSLDDDRAAWSAAITSYQLGWKHVSDLRGWKCVGSRIYAVNSIPNTILIDRSGKIVGRNLSIPEIGNLLSEKTQ